MNIKRPLSWQPIPEKAKRVFRGKLFDVYQWEQRLFNGEKAVFEKLRRPDLVNIIPTTANGEIVLGEQEQPGTNPFIGCFGGRIEEGEEPLGAAKRELLEETGMKASKYVLWDAIHLSAKIDCVAYTFIAKDCRRVQNKSLDAGEKIKLKFFSFEGFLKVVAQENFRDIEITLKVFRTINNPAQFEGMKKLFTE